jgi:ATP-dependent Clp protease ATP-binding subunit ClpA
MPKINVYLPDELAAAVRDAQVPVSAICQAALERAVRDIGAARSTDEPPTGSRVRGRLFRRFTDRARSAVLAAQREAREHGHGYIGTEHLLLGVLDEGANVGIKVLGSLDVEPDDLRAELVASLLPAGAQPGEKVPFTPLAKAVLEHAASESLSLGHKYIGCEHLLLGLVAVEDGLASQVLRRMGVELRTTRRAVTATLSGYAHAHAGEPPVPAPTSALAEATAEILRRLEAIEDRLASWPAA